MEMSQKQRFLAAVRGERPDVVPVAPLIHSRYAHRLLGRSDWKAVFEVHRMIGSCHHRGPISAGWHCEMPDGWRAESSIVERDGARTATRHVIHTPLGSLWELLVCGFVPDDPVVSKPVAHWIKDPERDWPVLRAWHRKRVEGFTGLAPEPVDEAVEFMGEDGMPSVGLACSLATIGAARGMQGMLYDLVDHPALIESVQEAVLAGIEKSAESFLASRSEVGWYDICWATGADMGPEMFRKWCLPEVRRITEIVHSKPGKYLGLYTLGKIRELLPMLVEAGVDFIETFEPNQGDISLAEAKRLYGRRVCLMGNFDCVILARGTAEQARAEARRCLAEGMEGGGYVLVTGDEVPADARLENLEAMVETVEQHGRY